MSSILGGWCATVINTIMKPSDILAEKRQPAPPITYTNASTGGVPMTFDSERAYQRWLNDLQASSPTSAAAKKSLPKADKPAQSTVPAKASAVRQGIDQVGDIEVMTTRTRGNKVAPVKKSRETQSTISHDYDEYPEFEKTTDDEEDDGGATSKVAKKAAVGGANSILIDEIGQKTIVQSFFSFPMLHEGGHQFYSTKSPLDKALYGDFKRSINAADYPIVRKGAAKSGPKISFMDSETAIDAAVEASHIVASVFEGQPLATHHGRPIFWVNHVDRAQAKSFALSHWVRIAPGTKLEDGDIVDHFIFGYFDTKGIPSAPSKPDQVMTGFSVGAIEQIINAFGVGAVALKRISGLKPSRALQLGSDPTDMEQLDGLDEKVLGKKLTDPWPQIKSSIKNAYRNKPVKMKKLLEITDQVIGKSASEPAKYPIKIKGISVKDVGFSTNALTVDFMEILHPLVAMKPNGVLNNGIYNAVRTYLGDVGEDGMTFDLTKMVVGYPNAANAKLFDSMLINPKTGGRLLISSKDGEGAMPGAGSLGAVYNLFEQHLKHFEEGGADPKMGAFITRTMSNAPDEYKQMMRFFSAIGRGKDKAELKDSLLPQAPGARKLAQRVLAGDTNVAADLNRWDGGGRFQKGGFLKFVTSVLRFSPLVQINTMSDKSGTPEFDRADDVTITGFMATWPNNIFDSIEFHEFNGLRFKIGPGGGTGEVSIRQKNDRQGERVHKKAPAFDRWSGRDYAGAMKHSPRYTYTSKINKMQVPGFGRSWDVLTNRLAAEVKPLISLYANRPQDLYESIVDNKKLIELFNLAMEFQIANGFDPGMSGVPDVTMRDLLNTIAQALEG